MSKVKLKVCGMRDQANILEVAALMPDYMGFIFYPGSKRFVGNDFVIPDELTGSIKRVGVFADQPVDEILKLSWQNNLDFIQLHGSESPDYCRQIRESGHGVIKAFGVHRSFDFKRLDAYREETVNFFLFDTKGNSFGGHGVAFDWSVLQYYDQRIPFFLSGGISPENVEGLSFLDGMNLHAIDINSKVEKLVGIKDVERIKKVTAKI